MSRVSYNTDTKEKFDNTGNSLIKKFSAENLLKLFTPKPDDRAIADDNSSSVGTAKRDPLYSSVSAGKLAPIKKNDTISDVTAKLYNLLRSSYERKVRNSDIQNIFQEHAEREKERRHQELLKVLMGYKPTDVVATTKPEETKGSLLDTIIPAAAGAVGGAAATTAVGALKKVGSKVLPFLARALPAVGVGLLAASPFMASEHGMEENPNETGNYKLFKPISKMSPWERFTNRVGGKRQSIEEMIESSVDRKTPVFTEEEAADIKKFYEIDVPKQTIGAKRKITLPENYQKVPVPEIGKESQKLLTAEPTQLPTPTPKSDKVQSVTREMNDLELEGLSGGTSGQSVSRTNVQMGNSKQGGIVGGTPPVRNQDETIKRTLRGSVQKT